MQRPQRHQPVSSVVDDDHDHQPWPWSRRCPVVDVEIRAMYWRLYRFGDRFPAESGVIVFDGGQR